MSKPSAKLISSTEFPLETLYFVWMQSRSDGPIPDIMDLALVNGVDQKILEVVKQLIYEDVPVTECIHFTFFLQNIPVSLREQLVRHRIGVSVGPLQGLDQIPELGSSTFWSQTSRMVSQEGFYSKHKFIKPEMKPLAEGIYLNALAHAQNTYEKLLSEGVPMEDARQVLPLAATQSMTWTLSLKALMHIIGKRACQIAQYNLWQPIITDMVNELCDKVHPLFRGIVSPPCISKGKYVGCPVEMVNLARINGEEGDYAPCSIYLNNFGMAPGKYLTEIQEENLQEVRYRFEKTWRISSETGLPLAEENTQK